MLHIVGNHIHLASNRPEQFFAQCTRAQIEQSEAKAVEGFVANLQGIVPVFQQARLIDFVVNFKEVFHQIVVGVGHRVLLVVPRGQSCRFEHFHHQHRMVGRERATRLADNVGMLNAMLVAHVHKGVDGIVGILLNGIIHRMTRHAIARTIIVYTQTAANVHKIDVETHSSELHIELRRFAQRILDAAYFGDLATDVEVNQFQRIGHFVFPQEIECLEKFAGVEPEFATVAAAFFPLAAAGRGEFDADTDIGLNTHALRHLGNEQQFVEFFHHEENFSTHFLRQQSQSYVALIFIAIANDERIIADIRHIDGKHGVQFRFRPRLKPNAEFLAMAGDFFHHGAHLIHLNGVNHEIFRLVVVFF